MRDPITVGISQIHIGQSPEVLRALALGSCVAIALYDPQLKLGGLSHAMLPQAAETRNPNHHPGKFVDSSITLMIHKLVQKGARPNRLSSKLAGGAKMIDLRSTRNQLDIGTRNIQSAHATLKKANIPIVAEDVGKNFARTVLFDLSSGKLIMQRAGENSKEL